MENKLLFIITFLFLVLISPFIWADTHSATSCKQEDVLAAINAASSGDTVLVPPGSATWTTTVNITKPISIIGAGLDKTILMAGDVLSAGFFHVYGFTSALLVRISGFKFDLIDTTHLMAVEIGTNNVSLDNLRIDHNSFNSGAHPVYVGGAKGVVDHNYFSNANLTVSYTAGNDAQADASWKTTAMVTGAQDALFIEDNNFIDDNNMASKQDERIGTMHGGKLVVRYNLFDSTAFTRKNYDGSYFNMIPFMSHGSAIDYYGGPVQGWYRRGQSIVEIYNNILAGNRMNTAICCRGSSNLIYGNIITSNTGAGATSIAFSEEEGWSWTVWSPLRAQWPGEDQVHNTFIWNNKLNGADLVEKDIFIRSEPGYDDTPFIQINRDFFLHAPQPGGGREYFECKPGFSECNGASDTYPTDGVKYPTRGTMKFTSDGANAYYPYVPFVYPHPLTVQSESGRLLGLSGTRVTGGTRLAWSAITGAVSYAVQRDWGTKTSVGAGVLTYTDNASGAMYLVEALDATGKILACEGVIVDSGVSQTINLVPGWNWISFNMLPADLSLNSVFSTILTQVEQVKGQSQSAIRSGNVWKGDLANMNGIGSYKMYKVKVNAACTLPVAGTAAPSANPIPLGGGWNWVAYLPTTAMPIVTALASINGQVQEIKSLTQSAIYNGTTWSGTLTQLDPGKGYAIRVSGAINLIYPEG
jgi:hypothetical protein